MSVILHIDRLNSVDDRLCEIIHKAFDGTMDITVLCGYRNEEDQNRAFANGNSKVKYPNSMHNTVPAMAVDIAPHPYRNIPTAKVMASYYFMAGLFIATANRLGYNVRWGGDWDGDFDIFDQKYDDLAHFELVEKDED